MPVICSVIRPSRAVARPVVRAIGHICRLARRSFLTISDAGSHQQTFEEMNVATKTEVEVIAPHTAALIIASLLWLPVAVTAAPPNARSGAAPSEQGALATVQEMARALRENDAEAITRVLADDWAVVTARGGLGEGKSIFPEGITSGTLTRTAFDMSEPRVRLYGDMAVVTSKVRTAGTFGGKSFDVRERETDVLYWQQGSWKIVLTHETFEEPRSAT
jgi:ketosteroid isomerase-like protein